MFEQHISVISNLMQLTSNEVWGVSLFPQYHLPAPTACHSQSACFPVSVSLISVKTEICLFWMFPVNAGVWTTYSSTGLAFLTSWHSLKVPSVLHHAFLSYNTLTAFCCMDQPHSVYPFASWWTSGLCPVWGCVVNAAVNFFLYESVHVDICFHFLRSGS